MLAVHFEQARDAQWAAQYRQAAAEQALRRGAYQAAAAHCRQGLELLATAPDTPARARRELTLLMTLGVALIATEGYTAREVERTYQRARTLCEQVGAILPPNPPG
jgi:hypothetical protein